MGTNPNPGHNGPFSTTDRSIAVIHTGRVDLRRAVDALEHQRRIERIGLKKPERLTSAFLDVFREP